jgi:hypothetical protein
MIWQVSAPMAALAGSVRVVAVLEPLYVPQVVELPPLDWIRAGWKLKATGYA